MKTKNEKRVYVVTLGEYSDYHIESIFSTEKAARDFMAAQPKDETRGVSEYTLNKMNPQWHPGYKFYHVQMNRGGDSDVFQSEFDTDTKHGTQRLTTWGVESKLLWEGFAKSKNHAVKIVNEIRVQMIAAGTFIDPPPKPKPIERPPVVFTADMYRQLAEAKKILE